MQIRLKRVYEAPSAEDGLRVLVDRLWPRGQSKEKAGIALWLKAIAPSQELFKEYHHDKTNWEEFKTRYLAEINANAAALAQLEAAAQGQARLTLLYAAKDEERNNALVLAEALQKMEAFKR